VAVGQPEQFLVTPVSGTSQLVPETSPMCHGFYYQFLPVPVAGSK